MTLRLFSWTVLQHVWGRRQIKYLDIQENTYLLSPLPPPQPPPSPHPHWWCPINNWTFLSGTWVLTWIYVYIPLRRMCWKDLEARLVSRGIYGVSLTYSDICIMYMVICHYVIIQVRELLTLNSGAVQFQPFLIHLHCPKVLLISCRFFDSHVSCAETNRNLMYTQSWLIDPSLKTSSYTCIWPIGTTYCMYAFLHERLPII